MILMSHNEPTPEKNAASGLGGYDDARALVRLIQCTQCSHPFRLPVTLSCGSSMCHVCLPKARERQGITYPDLPGRRQAFACPFAECGEDHPLSDCNVDVNLNKIMESIAALVATHASAVRDISTTMEEVAQWDPDASPSPSAEKALAHTLRGGRLEATYTLAMQGKLGHAVDLDYPDVPGPSESTRALDTEFFAQILEAVKSEVDCQVCYNTLLDPVTTFCGHTLCRKCLARVLDHSFHCPVCRRELIIAPSLSRRRSNQVLTNLLNGLCPETIAARMDAMAREEGASENHLNVPLFVCTLSFPRQPTFLRVFEPRYRLMLRRCLEGNREFGMVLPNRYAEPQGELGPVNFYQYGTMLRIVHSQLFPDGTSLVETRGTYRFRVTAHGVLDGYAVGSIERVEDVSLAEEERIEATELALPPAEEGDADGGIDRTPTQTLLDQAHECALRTQATSAAWLQQRVLDIHGQPPRDAALFPYWFASVLPISEEEKYKLLYTTTVRERLKITAAWIRRIESQRWNEGNSCLIL